MITGGIGNDVIDGGQGTDTAVFAGNITDYNFSVAGSTITVTDHVASRGGTDVLTNIEFLKFADITANVLDITVGGQTPDGAGHITVRHADGSRDVYTSGVTGKDYVSQHTVMDSAGHSVLIENFRGDGVMVLKQVVDASGVVTLDRYDGPGHVVQETVTQKDGSYLQSAYAPDGALATQTFRHADGSRDIYTYGIVGKDYTSQHVVNDPSGHTVLIEQFAADGTPVTEAARHFDGTRDATGHDALQADWTVAADPAHPSVHISGQGAVFDHGHDASVALPDAVMPLTWHDPLIV